MSVAPHSSTFLARTLGRATSTGRLIPAIDGLRCVAILAVILHHLGGYVAQRTPGLEFDVARGSVLYKLVNASNSGVQLFFLISGFILAMPFVEAALGTGRQVSLGRYLSRRIRRLHPPYLINLLVLTLLLLVVRHEAWSELGPHLLASSLYLHNIIYRSMSTINGVAWSLEIEVQFYLLAPLLAVVYRIPNAWIRRVIFFISIVLVMVAKGLARQPVSYPLSGSVLYYLEYFLPGMLLADWYASSGEDPVSKKSSNACWDLVAGLGMAGWAAGVYFELMGVLLPLFLSMVCAGALRGPRCSQLLSLAPIVLIGGMCYTIYLYHFAVISFAGRWVAPITGGCSYPVALAIQMSVVIPAILLVSGILFVLIEKPFMLTTKRTLSQHADVLNVNASGC